MDIITSLKAAFLEPLTWVVLVALVALLIHGWVASRRLKEVVAEFRDGLTKARSEKKSLKHLVADVPQQLHPLIEDLLGRWGVRDDILPTFRFSPSAEVITSDRVLATEKSWRIVEIAPGLATSIGILGTFLGISFGLGGIDLGSDPDGTDASAVFKSVGGVVDGLATAFWTSIFGVVVAIVINVRARRVETDVDQVVHAACDALDTWLPQLTPTHNQALLERSLKPLESLLARQIEFSASQDIWLKRNTILAKRQHAAQMQLLGEAEESHDTLRSLADDLVSKLEEGFGRAVGPILEKMANTAERVADAGVESAKMFVDNVVAGLQSGLSETISTVGRSMEDFHLKFEDLSERLERSAKHQLDVLEKGEAVAQRVQGRLEELNVLMTQASDFQKSLLTLESQHAALQERVSGSTAALIDGMGHVQTSLGAQLEGAKETIATIAEELGRARELVAEFKSGFGSASQGLRGATEALNARLEAESQLVERYAETAAAMGRAMDGARGFLTHAPSLASGLAEVARQQKAVADALKGTPEEVHGLVEALSERFRGVDAAAESMRGVVASTESWAGTANTAIRGFQEGVQQVLAGVLSQFDGELQRAVKALGAAMNELEDVILAQQRASAAGKR